MKPFGLKLVTAPAAEPVSLAEAKARLRVTIDDEDSDIESLIRQARGLCEEGCHRFFVAQTWTLYLDCWPKPECDGIRVPRPPLVSVASVKYYDTDAVQQTIDSADYYVGTGSEPGRIVPVAGYWPAVQLHRPDAIEIQFTAGYGPASAVPPAAKAAILVTVRALRDDPGAALPPAARTFLNTLEYGEQR
jgi:uncharacterized phiE125 gp8 family phage protein